MSRAIGAFVCALSWSVGCASPCSDGAVTPGAVCFGTFTRIAEDVSFPHGVAVIDVDEDGRIDVLIPSPNGVRVLLNEGDETFNELGLDAPDAYDVAGADFDRDERVDLVVAGDEYVQVLLGASDGTFTPGWRADVPSYRMAVGDFDGDNGPDLITYNFFAFDDITTPRNVELRLNDGTGELLSPRPIYANAHGLSAIDAVDIEGDGDLDLYLSFGPTDTILIKDGTGRFAASGVAPDRFWAEGKPKFADLDGDGDIDVIRGVVNNSLVAYINRDGGFAPQIIAHDIEIARPVVGVGDFDGDGDSDVMVTVRTGLLPDDDVFGIDIVSNLGDGTFYFAQRFVSTAEHYMDHMVAADLNGDHIDDPIAVTNDGEVHALFSTP